VYLVGEGGGRRIGKRGKEEKPRGKKCHSRNNRAKSENTSGPKKVMGRPAREAGKTKVFKQKKKKPAKKKELGGEIGVWPKPRRGGYKKGEKKQKQTSCFRHVLGETAKGKWVGMDIRKSGDSAPAKRCGGDRTKKKKKKMSGKLRQRQTRRSGERAKGKAMQGQLWGKGRKKVHERGKEAKTRWVVTTGGRDARGMRSFGDERVEKSNDGQRE